MIDVALRAPADDRALAIDGLVVRYPGRRTPALDGVSLSVMPGEMLAVAGRNGAGKSTLALGAAGFIPRVVRASTGGAVRVAGADALAAPAAALLGRVGIVFSTPSNQLSRSKLSVREELAFGLENLGVPREQMDARIDRTLVELGIGHLAGRLPTALSGGEQQRVAIAAVLCMGPGVLVLDEPTAQLDPAATATVVDLLVNRAKAGTTIVVTEHTAAVLGRATRCAVLEAGRIVVEDEPGHALAPGIADAAGVAVPTNLRVVTALGLDPALAFDDERLGEALARRSRAAAGNGAAPGGAAPGCRAAPGGGAAPGSRAAPAAHPGSRPEEARGPEPRPEPVRWEPVREPPPAAIEIDGLVHRYAGGVTALAGVDLAIAPGETVAIVGQNGSGKTTLARHLVGILQPTEGRVRIAGSDVAGRSISAMARTVGFVFQDPDRQLFSRSVEREIAFGPRNLGLAPAAVARLVEAALSATGLADRRAVNPYDLDASDRKLVALGSVLAMDPAVLVLDEPTTGQDVAGTARVGAIVDGFAAAGRTVIAITHDMEFAARHSRRVVVLGEGRVVADGAPERVFVPSAAGLLASTGLTPPPLARLAGSIGHDVLPPSVDAFLALLAGESRAAAPGGSDNLGSQVT